MTFFPVNSFLPSVFPIFVANNLLFIRYQIMLKCWEENPSDRPTFTKLKDTMKEIERSHRVSMGYSGDEWVFIFISFNYYEWEVTLYRTFFHFGLFFPFILGEGGGGRQKYLNGEDTCTCNAIFICDSLVITLTAFLLQTYVNLKEYDNNLYANVEDLTAE